MTGISKIEELRRALRAAGRTGYGDETDEGVDPAVTETSPPAAQIIREPQVIKYVTVHKSEGNPVVYDLTTGESRELTLK